VPAETPIDYSSSFDDAWRAFLASESLRLTDEIDAWSRGRAQFLAFIARIEDTAARAHVAHMIETIANIPGVEAFPDPYWHITIKGAGFQVIKRVHDDDVLRENVSRIVTQAKQAIAGACSIDAQLGAPNVFGDALVLEVHDNGELRALNARLLDGVDGIARYAFDGERYLPHVSIARFTSNDGLGQLKEMLSKLRAGPPGPRFQIRRLELIKAWLSEEVPEFETLATYALAPARPAGGAP
jgi:2'-5' RNA ligase